MLLFLLETLDDNDDKLLFSELYHEYKKSMLYAAYQILHDKDKSEDAVQQAFINIINQFSVIKKLNPQHIKPYFITAAKNTAKNILRSEAKYILSDDICTSAKSNISIIDEVVEKISTEELADWIGKLPEIYTQVLILAYIYDLNDKQIAKQLQISATTVRKRKERARTYLYSIFAEGEIDCEFHF